MIDFSPFFKELENNSESIQLVLEAFLEEYRDCQITINQLYKEQNWPQLFMLAHSLKGILTSFGETEVSALLTNIETQSRVNGPVNEVDINEICQLMPLVEFQVKRELDKSIGSPEQCE
jgi:HPt (histidine-containing phosphotransfer) domain-containing protein